MGDRIWKDLDEFRDAAGVRAARAREFDELAERSREALRDGETVPVEREAIPADAPPAPASGDLRSLLPRLSRRGFMRLTGAAAVFGAAGCWHDPPETLVPYDRQPEGATLGRPRQYNTAIREGSDAVAVTAKVYDGRTIKLDGNPEWSLGRGKLSLRGQAAMLDLYDPDRVQDGPLIAGKPAGSWDDFDAAIGVLFQEGRVGLITRRVDGPAHAAFLEQLKGALGGRLEVACYDPFAQDVAREARRTAFGDFEAVDPVHHFDRAEVLVTLGSDCLGGGTTGLRDEIAFGDLRRLRGRGAEAERGQVIAFEPMMTQGGSCADLRFRVAMEDLTAVAWALAIEVAAAVGREDAVPGWARELAAGADAAVATSGALARNPDHADTSPIAFTAKRLLEVHGADAHSLIYVGGATHCGANSHALHVAANVLNHLLGNEGVTVETAAISPTALTPSVAETERVLAAAADGEIETLVLVDANPAATLPGAAEKIAAAGNVVILGDRLDESATANTGAYFAPILHDLESWGDAEPVAGSLLLAQPVSPQLWDARAWQEHLIAFCDRAGLAPAAWKVEKPEAPVERYSAVKNRPLWVAVNAGLKAWGDLVREHWVGTVRSERGIPADPQTFWRSCLHRGGLESPAPRSEQPELDVAAIAAARPADLARDGFRLVISASRSLRDGRGANNPWLQETPDPVSKVVWDNYLALAIPDARELGVEHGSVVRLTADGRDPVELPVVVQAGQLPGTVETFFGWGRHSAAGEVARDGGIDGRQVQAFLDLMAEDRSAWGIPVDLEATGEAYPLACTQNHHYMDGRSLALDDNLELHRRDPTLSDRGDHHSLWKGSTGPDRPEPDFTKFGHNLSLWGSTHVYPGRRWGMNIDLSVCTGCNACLVACSLENNVPVVGRGEMYLGREMHWIRIDRYYRSLSVSDAEGRNQGRNASRVVAGETEDDPEEVEVFHQPMLCQQCGHASCEEVCPPMATMHNDEGINVQVYNRCIGTRYCGNNCPYKVRRFNYYEYSKYRYGPQGSIDPFGRVMKNLTTEGNTSSGDELTQAPLEMALNPEVTQRSKGIMEKCNFCIQRHRDIRDEEKRTGVAYDDADPWAITTACAQTCPTDAIVFGDINDRASQVSQANLESEHGFLVLDRELNMRPSVVYRRLIRHRPPLDHELDEYHHGVHAGHGAQGDHPEGGGNDHGDGGHDHDHDHGDHGHGEGGH